MTEGAVKVFFSYSHEDEGLRDKLAKHLRILERQGVIASWHDREISAGKEWANEIDQNMESACIILLLVSANFLDSDYCYDIELKRAIKRHEAGEACVIPIILKPAYWKGAPFAKLQALPKNARPVTTWENQDEAFLDIVLGIKKIVETLKTEIESQKQQAEEQRRQEAERQRQKREQAEYENKLRQYEQELTRAIQAEYPLDDYVRDGLKNFRESLELTDEDVAPIEKPILEQAEAKYQEQLKEEEANRHRQQEAQRAKQQEEEARLRQQQAKIQSPPVTEPQPTIKTQPFDFEVVTVNVQRLGLFGLGSKVTLNRSRNQAQYFTEDLRNGVILEMVAIPGGKFVMGAPKKEKGSSDNERPQHQVSVKSFFMGKYQVTQAQWRAVASFLPKVNRDLDPDPSKFKGVNRPLERVNLYDAVEFCARLSRETGREYRLPSEAEWEYACRARTKTPFYFGETITPDLANYNGNYTYGSGSKGVYREETTPVGQFPPNAFGLYDMHGNVWEWCADTWHDNYDGAPTDGTAWTTGGNDNYSPLRGGSWAVDPVSCRSATRTFNIRRDNRCSNDGFRVVCGFGRT